MLNPTTEIHEFDDVSEHSTTSSNRRTASKKTREELNEIEKQRTKRINGHIMSLRNLLEMSNILTKKDKFSVLKNTHDYIIKLRQALHLAEERIAKLNRSRPSGSGDGTFYKESDGNVPYDNLFMNSAVAMALTGVDGQFIACNDAFSLLSGFSKQEIRSISVFNFTLPEEMNQLFHVVGNMLSHSNQNVRHFWKTCKFREREETCFVSMWLIRQDDGEPAYFQLMMVPLSECTGAIGVPGAGGAAVASSTSSSKPSAPPKHGAYTNDLSGYSAEESPASAVHQARGSNHESDNLTSHHSMMGPPGAVMGAGGMVGLGLGPRVPGNESFQSIPRRTDSPQDYVSYVPPDHYQQQHQHQTQTLSPQYPVRYDSDKYDDIGQFAGSGTADCWSPGAFATFTPDYDDIKPGF
mmetsp:Transcript_19921/g.28638  ORF Transcript_19921/g.28638 Transcript_19921/m.28638 type:complete len:409 (-) Transcript_19921:308-1534(-)|eukprot:CAMPEP_0185030254 /NCGR_PEP_ID=MMETSP1103-20130426/17102_1 /TAXON_ID=36769 /ORGANISM="Paraphysomonas bandaiensis, Strain Caron Lab Isolate" /LENGTH=408 /DNA_ID=CAMNT_0027565309 /DNA_START=15 /DNA_END=1241 /DNA_ORIENTATION=+